MAIWRPGGQQDIYLMSRDGGELVQITSDAEQDCDPTWTPDGRHILFSSDPDGIYNIYSADTQTGEIRRVTNVLSGAFFPAVSPDGARLLFVGYGKDGYDLFIANLDIASARPAPRKHDPIPAPEPYPEYSGEIKPYTPLAHMTPKCWLPTFTGDTLGLVFLGLDPVGFRSYVASLGVDLANAGPPVTSWSTQTSSTRASHGPLPSPVVPRATRRALPCRFRYGKTHHSQAGSPLATITVSTQESIFISSSPRATCLRRSDTICSDPPRACTPRLPWPPTRYPVRGRLEYPLS